MPDLCSQTIGFNDSIRKFVCHVVGITFQTVDKTVLTKLLGDVNGKKVNIFTLYLSGESCLLTSYHLCSKVYACPSGSLSH
jgi:hypothetical protein